MPTHKRRPNADDSFEQKSLEQTEDLNRKPELV